MRKTNQFDYELGQSLRTARKQKKVNACKLSRAMEVHRNSISRWEEGESTITVQDFLRYCAAIKVSPWSVLPKEVAQ